MPDDHRLPDRHHYVTLVLDGYRETPNTPGRSRPADRRLAEQLHDQGVPLDVVTTALLLATCRRACRPADADPLEPIYSLHYFKPVIAEILKYPPDDGFYLTYLKSKVERLRHDNIPGCQPPQIHGRTPG